MNESSTNIRIPGNARPIGTTGNVCSTRTGKTHVPTDASVGPYSLIRFPAPKIPNHRFANAAGKPSPATTTTGAKPANRSSDNCRPRISK